MKHNTDPAEVYNLESVLMCHAELYVLADYLLLQNLKNLYYQRLGTAMQLMNRFRFDEVVTQNVADLARLVYRGTTNRTGHPEPLRNFVSSFFAANITEFVGGGIDALIDEGGDCAVDISNKFRIGAMEQAKREEDQQKRIEDLEKQLEELHSNRGRYYR